MHSTSFSIRRSPARWALLSALSLSLSAATPADEASFDRSLEEQKQASGPSRSSSHVAIFGGTTQDQSADMEILGVPYDLQSVGGSVHAGIRVGYEWRGRRYPVTTGLEFEGSLMSTELNGTANDQFVGSLMDDSISSFHTDMNAVMFFFNGRLELDLARYRARVGPVLSRFSPYVGGGVGGAQFWFNNTTLTTVDGTSLPNAAPFATDQFVFGHQLFAGTEFRLSHKVSIFGEYKSVNFDSFEDTNNLEHSSWLAGVKLHYDKKKEAEEE